MTEQRYVVIVDAYSSGSLYAPELRRRGFGSVHVQSTDPIPPDDLPAFVPGDHVANVIFDGDLERCLQALAPFAPRAVLAGCEQAVLLADRLSEALRLPTSNGTALSHTRRDKVAMQRRIAEAGLRSIPTQVAARWSDVEGWVAANLPVVVKPTASGGTDQVFICATVGQAQDAFHAILGKPNTFGQLNAQVIVQTLLVGVEYNVDNVSYDGRHFVTEIWRVDRLRVVGDQAPSAARPRGDHPIYDRGVMLPRRGAHQDVMIPYVEAVLDAIGIRFGPSHTELMWTADGPVLIEVAARLHGQKLQLSSELVTGISQATLALDAYLAPERFRERAATPYELHRELQRIELVCPRTGTLRGYGRLDDVRALRSFHKIELFIAPGSPIAKTTDLMTVPGFIDLIHVDPAVVEADHAQIRAWELADFYDIVAA